MSENIKGTGVFDGFEGVNSNTGGCSLCHFHVGGVCTGETYYECCDLPVTHWIKSPSAQPAQSTCDWRGDGEYYQAGCGPAHYFAAGNIEENRYKFCPYCGKKIKVVE